MRMRLWEFLGQCSHLYQYLHNSMVQEDIGSADESKVHGDEGIEMVTQFHNVVTNGDGY